MTVLRHRVLDAQKQPVAGRVATVAAYEPLAVPADGYRRTKVVSAISGNDGWLSWTLPSGSRKDGKPVTYVVVGIEDRPVLVTPAPDVSTTTVTESRTGVLPIAEPSEIDLVTEEELAKRISGLTAELSALPELRAAFGTVINAVSYGVTGVGTADVSSQMAAAAAAAVAAGGGTILLPSGTIHAANVPVRNNVTWQGQGRNATKVKLPNGSTGHVFKGENFDTLDGTNVRGGPYGWAIRDLTIDGNKANCPSGGKGVAVFGYEYVIEDVNVLRCKNDGVYLSYHDSGGGAYVDELVEGFLSRVKVFDCDGNGFNTFGSHDSVAESCIAARNALCNFRAGGNAWNWMNCHAWGAAQYGWFLTGENMLVNCQGEGATEAQFFIQWHGTRILGGVAFHPGSATAVGVQIGDATHKPEKCQITGMEIKMFSSASGSAVDLTNAGPGLRLSLLNEQDTGTAVVGTPPADSVVDVQTKGAATNGNLFQRPGLVAATEVPLPPALYDPFLGADGAALDAAKWTVTKGTSPAAAAEINGNRAKFTAGAAGGYTANDRVYVVSTLPTSLVDVEMMFKLEWGAVATESYLLALARADRADIQSGATGYSLTASNTNIALASRVAGTSVSLWQSNFPGIGLSGPVTGSSKWVKWRLNGSTHSMKVWEGGAVEPAAWTVTLTDSAVLTGGRVGFNMSGGAAATSGMFYVDNARYTAL